MAGRKILIYMLRKDLRVADNPVLHHLASCQDHGFTHMLPVFVFPAHQIEVSGFLKDGTKSPYPEARGRVSRYWRCGPHRAKFIAESVWSLKAALESLDSGLELRVGTFKDVTQGLLDHLGKRGDTGAVWITGDVCPEETADEDAIEAACQQHDFGFQRWVDEKYFIYDNDLNFKDPHELPQIFTDYRKSVEPLRQRPKTALPRPARGSLPPFPEAGTIAEQAHPFVIPDSYEKLEPAVVGPVKDVYDMIVRSPDDFISAHPFHGGEATGQERLDHIVRSGILARYKQSRNGLIGTDFSTKVSAYLAQGCITARQVHEALVGYEDGTKPELEGVEGFGKGETEHTKAVREELMWRDYMRLYARKIKAKLFDVNGYEKGGHGHSKRTEAEAQQPPTGSDSVAAGSSGSSNSGSSGNYWKTADAKTASTPEEARETVANLERLKAGTTGLGLIDASQRELLHTGYTSNRGRQNVASFLAKHLGIDWRYGAEWYEMLLVDYDVCSNWGNWQYVAGVGFDPRGKARIFNPIKQAFDYDKDGAYVRMWVPELAPLTSLENLFQVSTTPAEELEAAGLAGNIMATDPVKQIRFNVNGKPPSARQIRRQAVRGGPRGGGRGGAAAAAAPAAHGGGSSPKTGNADGAGHGNEQDRTRATASAGAATDNGTGRMGSSNMQTMPPHASRGIPSNRGHHRGSARGAYHGAGVGRGGEAGGNGGSPATTYTWGGVNKDTNINHRGSSFEAGGGGGSGWHRRGGPNSRATYSTTASAASATRGSPTAGGFPHRGGRSGAMVVNGSRGCGFTARAADSRGGRGASLAGGGGPSSRSSPGQERPPVHRPSAGEESEGRA